MMSDSEGGSEEEEFTLIRSTENQPMEEEEFTFVRPQSSTQHDIPKRIISKSYPQKLRSVRQRKHQFGEKES